MQIFMILMNLNFKVKILPMYSYNFEFTIRLNFVLNFVLHFQVF